jgi:hypothetical protein
LRLGVTRLSQLTAGVKASSVAIAFAGDAYTATDSVEDSVHDARAVLPRRGHRTLGRPHTGHGIERRDGRKNLVVRPFN